MGLPRPLRVLVVDPVPDADTAARHRTWCFWAEADVAVAPAVHATWRHVRVSDPRQELVLDLDPLRYHLVRSDDLAAHVADLVARAPRLHVERVEAAAGQVTSCADHAHVLAGGRPRTARLVLDSRPARPDRPGSVWWWQHFRGWTLPAGALPPDDRPGPAAQDRVADLMDFRTAQPAEGLSFGYLLPLPDGRALAEYTEFSPTRLDDAGYDRALRAYLDLLGVDRGGPARARGDRRHPHDRRRVRPPAGAALAAHGHRGRGDPRVHRLHVLGHAPRRPGRGRPGRRRGARRAPARSACRRRTRPGTAGWTRCSCRRWRPAGSTARGSSPTCSPPGPPVRCSASSTAGRPWPRRSGS